MYIFVGTNSCNTKLIKSSSRFPRFALWLYISHLWMADGPYLGLIPIVLKWPMILTLVSWEPAVRPLLTLAVNGQQCGQSTVGNIARMLDLINVPYFLSPPVKCEVIDSFWKLQFRQGQRQEFLGMFEEIHWSPSSWWVSGLLLPELLCLAQDLGALHPQEHEHGHDGQQRGHRVRDDVLKQETRLAQGHNSSRSECSLRREAIRNALFLQRKVPENPHRKNCKCKIVGSEQNLSKLDKSDLYFIGFRLQVCSAVWAIMAHCELWLSSMFDQEHLG